jgi:Helitron helicase-like domain at N-terminus
MHNVANKKVTQRCYYAYRLFPWITGPNTIFQSGQLFQQHVVDAWASVEQSELFWIQTNQKTIRADLYQGLRDMVEDSYNTDDIVEMG